MPRCVLSLAGGHGGDCCHPDHSITGYHRVSQGYHRYLHAELPQDFSLTKKKMLPAPAGDAVSPSGLGWHCSHSLCRRGAGQCCEALEGIWVPCMSVWGAGKCKAEQVTSTEWLSASAST